MQIHELTERTPQMVERLTAVWEASVRATHLFLSDTEVRRIKANLVSVNVERLAREGYLVRQAVQGDRRKARLILTEKARPVIDKGRQVQQDFFNLLFRNTDEETRRAFFAAMETMEKNLDQILEDANQ